MREHGITCFLLKCLGLVWDGFCAICVTDYVEKVSEIDVLKPKTRVWDHRATSEAHLEPKAAKQAEVSTPIRAKWEQKVNLFFQLFGPGAKN